MHYFIGNWDFVIGSMFLEDSDLAHQLKSVLKLNVNEKIFLGDGRGRKAKAVIKNIGKKIVEVEVEEIFKSTSIDKKIFLFCSILKRENFEWVIEKATEVGVDKVVPLISDRTIKSDLNLLRLQKIVKEASEQSARFFVPEILSPLKLDEAIKTYGGQLDNLFCHFGGLEFNEIKIGEKVGVWIGPEGGWSEEEIKKIHEFNFRIVSLGENVLRAETAAIVGVWAVFNV